MQEPWNLKADDSRQTDTLPTFIIFTEDEVSENIYFKYFETSKIKINIISNQKSKLANVIKAIAYCDKNDLFNYDDDNKSLKSNDIQVWCVYDRDTDFDDKNKLDEGNVAFSESITMAENSGLKVAWSNDAFELWVLLHFEDIDLTNEESKKRTHYYSRLTEIFKNIPNPSDDLKKALEYSAFEYKRSLKSENNFRYIIRPLMIENTEEAITRAKNLLDFHKDKNKYCDKNPCTLVFHLVEELLKAGGKPLS